MMLRSLIIRFRATVKALAWKRKEENIASEKEIAALPLVQDVERTEALLAGTDGICVCRERAFAGLAERESGSVALRAGRIRRNYPPGLWLYRGSEGRNEVEMLLAAGGLEMAFEYEASGVQMPLESGERMLSAPVAQADSPSAFVRFSRERDVRFVGFLERRVPDAVEKTYVALDERLRVIVVLRMMYPMPPGVFYRLYRGVIFSPRQLGNQEASRLLAVFEQAFAAALVPA